MIDYERAKQIAVNASDDDECVQEYAAVLEQLSQSGPEVGRLSARSAWEVFSHRAEKGRADRIDVRGIDRVVEHLAALRPDETVLLFLFENAQRDYTIFITERDESFIGCMSVPRRPHRVAPPGWDGFTKFWQDDEEPKR